MARLLPRLLPGLHSMPLHHVPLLCSLLLLLALLLPTIDRPTSIERYLLVFDISQSMDVQDVTLDGQPQSRFLAARQAAGSLISALPCGSEIGLAVFAATRTVTLLTTLEVCEHYNGLMVSLDAIDARMRFKNASSIGKGIHQSLRAAATMEPGTAILFFTDGHEAPPLGAGQTGMPKSEGHDVSGFIIGVGGDRLMQIPKVDSNGRSVGYWQADDVVQGPASSNAVAGAGAGEELSSLRETHLRSLGEISGLGYARLVTLDSFIDTVTRTSFSVVQPAPRPIAWIPASLALLLLSLRFMPFSLRTKLFGQ